ncbi:MAG: metallophosphoesterase N-terminal domain-containing protein, partial [Gemmatimonadales bacterium]
MASTNATTGSPRIDRRRFLGAAALGAAGLMLPDWLMADPYRPWVPRRVPDPRPIRIRGQVRVGGRGLEGVAVTDGLAVVESAGDGSFELLSTTRQEFVALSPPAGYQVPQSDSGTARFYQRIAPRNDGEQSVEFDLAPLDGDDERHACLLLADPQTE